MGCRGRKFESCRIRLKLCRPYVMDPPTTPAKFRVDRPKHNRVMGQKLRLLRLLHYCIMDYCRVHRQ